MEELINTLAGWQAESQAIIDEMAEDKAIEDGKMNIAILSKQLHEARAALYDLESAYGQEDIKQRINKVKAQIIDEWDEGKKTYTYPAGTLSFRKTSSLHIIDDVRLMELLLEKTSVLDVVNKYIKGFKLTEAKKFVDVHNVNAGVALMEYKTTVSLKPKE